MGGHEPGPHLHPSAPNARAAKKPRESTIPPKLRRGWTPNPPPEAPGPSWILYQRPGAHHLRILRQLRRPPLGLGAPGVAHGGHLVKHGDVMVFEGAGVQSRAATISDGDMNAFLRGRLDNVCNHGIGNVKSHPNGFGSGVGLDGYLPAGSPPGHRRPRCRRWGAEYPDHLRWTPRLPTRGWKSTVTRLQDWHINAQQTANSSPFHQPSVDSPAPRESLTDFTATLQPCQPLKSYLGARRASTNHLALDLIWGGPCEPSHTGNGSG